MTQPFLNQNKGLIILVAMIQKCIFKIHKTKISFNLFKSNVRDLNVNSDLIWETR